MVIAPWGELLISGQTEEGIYYAELDLQEVDHVRKTIPIFQDRRTDLYRKYRLYPFKKLYYLINWYYRYKCAFLSNY